MSGTGTTGDKTITGLTDPKAIFVWGNNRTSAGTGTSSNPVNFSIGAATYRGGSVSQWTAGLSMESGDQGVTHNGMLLATDACLKMLGAGDLDGTPAVDFELDLVSMDSTSVTLNVANVHGDGAILVHYLIFGGADITDALAGTTTASFSSGNNDITVASGFGKPDLICAATVWDAVGVHANSEAQLSLGWGYDDTNQVVSNSSDGVDSSATVAASSYQTTGKLLQTINNGVLDWSAALTATSGWPTDGFQLNFSGAVTDDVPWLALKGSFNKKVGVIQNPGSTGSQDTNLGFAGSGALFWGDSQTTSASITTAQTTAPRLVSGFVGGTDGTNESSAGWSDDDANGNQRGRIRASTTQAVEMQSNNAGTVTISGAADASFSGNNLNLNWTAVPAVTRDILYVAVGSPAAGGAVTPKALAALGVG